MPRITTESGRTLDDVLNDECHDADGRVFDSGSGYVSITRRGDSIVPPAMIWEGRLPPIAPAFRTENPHTSHHAAASVAESAHRHRIAILTALKLYGPATGHEIAQRLGLSYVQVAKRLSEMSKPAHAAVTRRKTGEHNGRPMYQTRNSPTGHACCVWHLNPTTPNAQGIDATGLNRGKAPRYRPTRYPDTRM
jgi:hypothetical protein